METVAMNAGFWQNKKVVVTGHTGFKGGWLALWLCTMGAEVHGYALEPPTEPNLFTVAGIGEMLGSSTIGNICDPDRLGSVLESVRPEVVFHLAAQPLVRYSYDHPVETYMTNVIGTVCLMEALRSCPTVRAVVNVTTDKCYENREWPWGYRESEPLGGYDPYSSSKACSELVTSAYRRSYFTRGGPAVATARAGNVLGGGDWSADRLVPDALRALDERKTLVIRSPLAVRPWQHVLEPLSGYLMLAERLYVDGAGFDEPWNFGPSDDDSRSVSWILECLSGVCPELVWNAGAGEHPHEAGCLRLDSGKARARLGWRPHWNLETALARTVEWHRSWRQNSDMRAVTVEQIHEYANCRCSG